jgi:hypothetical protein
VSVSFFATPVDILAIFTDVFSKHSPVVYEIYSVPGEPIRSFSSRAAIGEHLKAQAAPHLALWFPEVMPQPSVERFLLNSGVPRFTVHGCGLFWLHVGAIKPPTLVASQLTWFSEAGARAKCSVAPGPEAVVWPAHKRFGTYLTGLLRRRLKAASVPGKPVLADALRAHHAGLRLVEHSTATFEYQVGAT